MSRVNSQSSEPQPAKKIATLWPAPKVLLTLTVMLGLVALNVLTLINNDVHTAEVNILKAVLAPAMTETTLSRILSKSTTQKYFTLEKSYKAIEARNAELNREHAVKADVVKRVSTRIGRRTVANAAKNASSFAAEVVPAVGTAVILTVTLSDIYDDCQTLKDLNELNITFDHEKEDDTVVCGMEVP
jgi:hypothetical protein